MRQFQLAIFWAWVALTVAMPSARSAEPAEEFLQKLRERGYFDTAEFYLVRMKGSPLSPPGFQDSLPYEQALSYVQNALQITSPAERAIGMAKARSVFEDFIEKSPDSRQAASARSWISRILLEQARVAAAAAETEADEAGKVRLLNDAAKFYDEAEKSFSAQVAATRERLLAMRKSPDVDPNQRDRLQNEYLQSRFAIAEIMYDKAQLQQSDRKAYETQLEKAAKEFGDLGDKYGKKLVGLQSVVLQGKCYQDLGKFRKATTYYQEFLDPSLARGPLQTVAAQAVTYLMQCWSSDELRQADKAIQAGETWLDQVGMAGATVPTIQGVHLELARIQMQQAENAEGADRKRLRSAARKHVLSIARKPGPRQREARKLLADLPGADSPPTAAQVDSFDEAKLAGDEAYEAAQSIDVTVRLLKRQLAQSKDPNGNESLRKERDELERTIAENRKNATAYYRQALFKAPRDLNVDEMNGLRFRLAYLAFGLEEYFEAAAIGEFVATKFPDFAFARNAANLAMAAYLRIYGNGTDTDTAEFARPRAVAIADYLAQTWPNEKEAQDALVTLVSFMVSIGDTQKAQAYLEKIPPDSPRRGEAELRTGQALWADYVQRVKGGEEPDEALRSQAATTLRQGVETMRKFGKSPTLVQAAMSLAQIYVATEQPDEALQLLNDDEIGPVTLVLQKHPMTRQTGFESAAYKTLLRAHLGKMADPATANEALVGARDAMAKLKAATGDTEQGRQRLVATYIGLARDLKEQMVILSPSSKQSIAKGFEVFLDQVSADSKEFNVLNWVAETFLELGAAFETVDGELTPMAKQYYSRAGDAYESILQRAEVGDLKIEDNYKLQVRMRRASAMRRLGAYKKAIDEFEKVLRKRNNMINVQMEAAQALHAGGAAGQTELFNEAVNGGRRNPNTGKNTIWGWSQIGRIAQAQMRKSETLKSKFSPIFFRSLFEAANCRYQQAMATDEPKKSKYLNSAKRTIGFLQGSYPEMGGETQRAEFDRLLKRVQQELGESVTGLGRPPSSDGGSKNGGSKNEGSKNEGSKTG